MIGGLLVKRIIISMALLKLVRESKVTFQHYIYRVHINRSKATNYIFIVQILTGMNQVIRYKPPNLEREEVNNAR